ncbi:cAMP-binding domain of CRP or a regulatory subunit of cAMP-dependent protein kinases [Methylobacterium phyllostachyos]|uniref:cAMP-binding domain of CRP or a regulatory subunit of cAMP-dependent protein kinases n=1 Tax=Methylobacterium phyllostachyos TaxID=582672 RepID=A0A1G9WX38_9HYPH|nr:Crp/Fnr family transcriptional regulator [Methylobacterium phyllostachyos]SDM89144.1 cAMP-binding domain of CRP or a regulatory subunit of cAMP-dependent protein kinases [Methylobacterium phyllostachyos]
MPSHTTIPFEGNLLLDALNARDRAFVEPHLVRTECARGTVLFEVGDDVSQVTFPLHRTIATLIVPLRGGRTVETATVGHEGAIGGVVSQGYLPAFTRCIVQIEGAVLYMDADRLREAKRASPTLNDLFVRYADCLLAQILQSVACNAAHPIEQRVVRWLLTLQDRLGTDALPVTQNVLATMLGVGRSYITGVLGTLQDQGLIVVGRGRIHLLDRGRAEDACCECHGRVRQHFNSVMGAVTAPGGEILAVDATPVDAEPPWPPGAVPHGSREVAR